MARTPFFARRRATALVDKAHSLDASGAPELAWLALEEAIREDPDSFEAEFLLGRIANDRKAHEMAVGHLERACRLNAKASPAFSELGRAYHELQRRAEAEEAYKKSLALQDDPYTAINFATLLRDTGRFGEATELYRRALASSKLDAETAARIRGML